jgi:hypothetical protein
MEFIRAWINDISTLFPNVKEALDEVFITQKGKYRLNVEINTDKNGMPFRSYSIEVQTDKSTMKALRVLASTKTLPGNKSFTISDQPRKNPLEMRLTVQLKRYKVNGDDLAKIIALICEETNTKASVGFSSQAYILVCHDEVSAEYFKSLFLREDKAKSDFLVPRAMQLKARANTGAKVSTKVSAIGLSIKKPTLERQRGVQPFTDAKFLAIQDYVNGRMEQHIKDTTITGPKRTRPPPKKRQEKKQAIKDLIVNNVFEQ